MAKGKPVVGLMSVPLFVGKPLRGSIGRVDGSRTGGLLPGVKGAPFAGLKGIRVVGLIGNPDWGSVAKGRPVIGLYKVPLLSIGKSVIGSIGNDDGSIGDGEGRGADGVVGDTGMPFIGLNGTDVVGSMGKPVTLSIASGRPVLGLYKVPLLLTGKLEIGSIGSAETLIGVGEAKGGVAGDMGIPFAGSNGTRVLGLIGKPVALSIARG
jgi:hypothetical protein